MYNYPMPMAQNYFYPIQSSQDIHSMGESLYPYLKMKINTSLDLETIKSIKIIGRFDREEGISDNEKQGKLFNYMRPTVFVDGDNAEIRCFPGIDYVFHFCNIFSTYLSMQKKIVKVDCELPHEKLCWDEICKSSLKDIPKVDTVIMGYVEGLDFLSRDKIWRGNGNFLYKEIEIKSGKALLLGCKHTYWGEIAGRIIVFLSSLGVKRVIYSGKLGTLKDLYVPNETIATGNTSVLPNGEIIMWDNLFHNLSISNVKHGVHITVPSVLQETKRWVEESKEDFSFVDPEIGHMAYAAKKMGMNYSYLHIISDNLSRKYSFDLSNERRKEVLLQRQHLMKIIGRAILDL